MAKVRLPLAFDDAVKALLGTKPPPAGTPGSRKAVKRKTKRKAAKKR